MHASRKTIPQSVRMTVAARQRYNCKLCKRRFGSVIHIDHIRRVADGGSNHIDNLQALCPSCHEEKTQLERLESLTLFTTRAAESPRERNEHKESFRIRPKVDGSCAWCGAAVSKYFDHACTRHPAAGALVTLDHVKVAMSHVEIQDEEVLSPAEEERLRWEADELAESKEREAELSSLFSKWRYLLPAKTSGACTSAVAPAACWRRRSA